MLIDDPAKPRREVRSPTRALVYLSCAAFASAGTTRMCDSLLPQIASDFRVSIGRAAIIVTAYAVTYGLLQAFYGPLGDRVGKYRVIMGACLGSALTVAACALAPSLQVLTIARLISGGTAAAVIPLSIAFIGDVVPFAQRQVALARFMSGQIAGLIAGQVGGGLLGEYFGWRAAFGAMGGVFLLVAAALAAELVANPAMRATKRSAAPPPLREQYRGLIVLPLVRLVLIGGFLEGMIAFGAIAYIGALMRVRFDLTFGQIGLTLACFGIGGALYTLTIPWIARRFGERGTAWIGTTLLVLSFAVLAVTPSIIAAVAAVTACGTGFYFFHTLLQLNATQMAPASRGAAVSLFACCFYAGQAAGVAVAAPFIDRFGAGIVFAAAAILMAGLGLWFTKALGRLPAAAD
ncbi:MAG: MFS transporter [Beijerinckiaceae bacterium]